jgi:gliding motility-associated-like protein
MQNGCSKRDSIVISYKPMPAVALGNDTTLCEGNMLLLNAANPGATYVWQNQTTNPVLTVTTPGLYNVLVNLNGCINKDTVKVNYLYKPIFSLGNDTAICKGQSITLRPNLSNVLYTWQNGSTAPDYTIYEPGTYRLTASNKCGSASDTIIVSRGICQLYMPNAFTPNRDGLNDVFKVKDPSFIKTFEMTIFNRYGQMIYKTTNPNVGWDGTFKNKDQPGDIYVWQINLTNLDDERIYAKGTVMLLR